MQMHKLGSQLSKATASGNDGKQEHQPEQVACKHNDFGVEMIREMLDHGGHHRQQPLTKDQ